MYGVLSPRSIAVPTHPFTAEMSSDLYALCGPRFNAFTPAKADVDRAGDFFRPKLGTVDRPRWAIDDEAERFDGMA